MVSNPALVPGVSRFSRSKAYAKKALFKKTKAVAKKAAAVAATKTKTIGGAKNGKTRVVALTKGSRFYPADDIPVPKKNHKVAGTATLRASITPGTVLILLAGRFRGKRVVFLKQLDSGLLLVTGPHKLNGVPIRRVNQAYVIATSTKVDISSVKVDAKFSDDYFKVAKAAAKKATAEALLGEDAEKKVADPARVADQKSIDSKLLAVIKKTPALKGYLSSKFALSKGQYPHAIKF
ncbi:ribosomal protein L6e-domain-containing protein [Entophlyctis helioformis]|nr:ribosomal protein L6e-domain-containing protein [Entophlyctis helioformis]